MQFGVSELYAACDWANAYKVFLEKWVTITDALSKFAMQLTGANKRVATAAVSKLQEMIPRLQQGLAEARAQGGGTIGGTFVTTPGTKLEPIKTSGITTSMDDARRLMLMVCSATGINEPYLTGDPSTGNLATAKSMERPMELQFTARQSLWSSILGNILDYIIDQAAMMPSGPLHAGATVEIDDDGDRLVTLGTDPETGGADEPDGRGQVPVDPQTRSHRAGRCYRPRRHAQGRRSGRHDPDQAPDPDAPRRPRRRTRRRPRRGVFPEGEDSQPDDSEAALARAIGKLEAYLVEAEA